jgi:hypothetical protein
VTLRNVSFRRVILASDVDVTREVRRRCSSTSAAARLARRRTHDSRAHPCASRAKPEGPRRSKASVVATPAAGGECTCRGRSCSASAQTGLDGGAPVVHSFRPRMRRPRCSASSPARCRARGRPRCSRCRASISSSGAPTGDASVCSRVCATCCPGRYSFGVTGRDPTGLVLPSGDYQLRLLAYGTDPGPPTSRRSHSPSSRVRPPSAKCPDLRGKRS